MIQYQETLTSVKVDLTTEEHTASVNWVAKSKETQEVCAVSFFLTREVKDSPVGTQFTRSLDTYKWRMLKGVPQEPKTISLGVTDFLKVLHASR